MPYCPSCGGEFVDRVSICPDCEVPLTAEPPEDGWDDETAQATLHWETVLQTGDPALLAVVKSVLQDADVPYVVIGEGLQNLDAAGVLGTGYNPAFGPARVQVPSDRAASARALLSEQPEITADPADPTPLEPDTASEPGGAEPGAAQRGRWGSGFLLGAGVGLLIGIVAGLAIIASGRLGGGAEGPAADGLSGIDTGLVHAQKEDSNGDGRPDRWYEYDDAQQVRIERVDTDFDGTPDGLYEYESGQLVAGRRDTDFDGTFDQSLTYRNDVVHEVTWEARPGAPARRLTHRHGIRHEELRDRDGDGDWDLRIVYDPFEYPAEEVELRREPPP